MIRVLLAGGGSGGSSTPLLAVAHELRRFHSAVECLYVGTTHGPERGLAEQAGIPYFAVPAGRLRRYFDWQNFADPFRVLAGVAIAAGRVRSFRPDVGFGAGGFAAVPPLLACRLLGVPIAVHQQDVIPGLANRMLAPFATRVSVSLEASLSHFPQGKTTFTGNPVRASVLAAERERAVKTLALDPNLPTLLVTGGGTGALVLNRLVAEVAPSLVEFCQVIHVTGRGRQVSAPRAGPRYRAYEFLLDEMPLALAAADLVVSRAGMATLTELAALGKPALLVPMPASHQEANAHTFAARSAVQVMEQSSLTGARLTSAVRALLEHPEQRARMSMAIQGIMPLDAGERIARLLLDVAGLEPASVSTPAGGPAGRTA